MKALVKDRDQRYASALDFARDLASAAQPPPRSKLARSCLHSNRVADGSRRSISRSLSDRFPAAKADTTWQQA